MATDGADSTRIRQLGMGRDGAVGHQVIDILASY